MHIILTKNMHMSIFFLFSKIFMSKYNIYIEKKSNIYI